VAPHTSRFTVHLLALNAGALIVVSALAFGPRAAAWITLGLGAVVLLGALTGFAQADQGLAARSTEVLLVLAGAWTIVACRAFSGAGAVRWTCLADGILIWGLGGLGLIAHEALVQGRLRRLRDAQRHRREPAPRPTRPLCRAACAGCATPSVTAVSPRPA